MTIKIPKIDKAAMYVVLESHIGADAVPYRAGDRIRGSHPDVQRLPQFYIEDGASSDELRVAHQQRFDLETLLSRKEKQ
jgi:hypothetical protein